MYSKFKNQKILITGATGSVGTSLILKLIKNYEGKMIGFGDILNDSEIDSILAYIKSYWSEEKYNIQLNISVVNN